MKNINKIIIGMLILGMSVACSSTKTDTDFWSATISVLEDELNNNTYNQDNWQIGVQDKALAEDEKHRSMTISYVETKHKNTYTSTFSLQNRDDKKTIGYHYEISEVNDDNDENIVYSVDVVSNDDAYTNYDIQYGKYRYVRGNFQDKEEGTSSMRVQNKQITYGNVPLLNETMEANRLLLERFEDTFDIQYENYDFITVPKLSEAANIPIIQELKKEEATTLDYYSKARINAKGYSLITSLKVEKDYSSVLFSEYGIEQKTYSFQFTIPLEKRSENIYHLVQIDPENDYVVYFVGENAYMYLQSVSDEEIINDVSQQNASQAMYVLSTTNDAYPK